jgi:hypothetical protein
MTMTMFHGLHSSSQPAAISKNKAEDKAPHKVVSASSQPPNPQNRSLSESVSLMSSHESCSSSSKGKGPEKSSKRRTAEKKPKAPAYNVAAYNKGGRLFGSFTCMVEVDERSPEASVIKSNAKIALQDRTHRRFKLKCDKTLEGKLKIEFIPKSRLSAPSKTYDKIDGAMKSLVANCAFKPMSCGGVKVSGGPAKYKISWTVKNVKAGSDMANAVQAMIDNHFRDRYDPGTRPKERSKIRERCPKDTLQGDYTYWTRNGDKTATAKEAEQAINRICENANRLVQQGYDAQELAKMHFLAELDVETPKSLPNRPETVKLSAWFGPSGKGAHIPNLTPPMAEVVADVASHVMKDAAPWLGISNPTVFNVSHSKLDANLRLMYGPGTILKLSKPSKEHYVLHRSLVAIIVEEIRQGIFEGRTQDEIADDKDRLQAVVKERLFARHVRKPKPTEKDDVELDSVEQTSFEVDS